MRAASLRRGACAGRSGSTELISAHVMNSCRPACTGTKTELCMMKMMGAMGLTRLEHVVARRPVRAV
eukprot:3486150-Prymnesium_polylepis.1